MVPMLEAEKAFKEAYGGVGPLMRKWKPYLKIVEENAKEEGHSLDEMTLVTTAICLENTSGFMRRMDEATLSTDVGSFIHHGFDLITAVMPSLIANEIVSVQPQTRRVGEIFYLQFLFGSNKGANREGDVMFGFQAAGNSGVWYTSQHVDGEPMFTAPGGAKVFANTDSGKRVFEKLPITPGSFSLTDGVEMFRDDGATALVGSAGGSGAIDYGTGAWSVTFNANVTIGTVVRATYETSFEANPDNIPEVDLQIASLSVTAKPRKLRARYSLDASFDVESAFGRSVGSDLDVALASEIRQEIDGELMGSMLSGAQAGTFNWSATPPSTAISYAEHKWTFITEVVKASNAIFTRTRRAVGSFIIAGVGACNVIEDLAPRFKREGKVLPGPHYIGTLDGMKVYKNPWFPANTCLVGYKGDMFVEAGLVYAPYMPIFTTRPIMLDDFVSRKGLATSYASRMVNPYFYAILNVTA